MRLEKISFIIAIVCAVIVLAVPFFRGFADSQIRQINPSREKNIWAGKVDSVVPNSHPKTDAQLLKEHPNDFLLRLALAQKMLLKSSESRRTEQEISRLLHDYPGEGVVYILAMELPEYANIDEPRRMEGSGMTSEEAANNWHPKPTTNKQIDSVLHYITLLDKAIAADPDNGYFHYIKSYYLHCLHRDSEARDQMHLSAISPKFTDYTDLRARSIDHIYDLRGGFNPIGRSSDKTVIMFPILARMREEARITGHLAYKDIRNGNIDQGVRSALDITNSGYNMAKNAPTTIHALVGVAIHAIGATALDPTFKPKIKDNKAQQAARFARYKQFLNNHNYPSQAATLEKQWQQGRLYSERMRTFLNSDKGSDYVVLSNLDMAFTTNTAILTMFLLFTGVWIAASLFTIRSGANGLWDIRAAATSALLSALVFVPIITDLIIPPKQSDFSALLMGEAKNNLLNPMFLLIPLGIIVIALLSGLFVMLKRNPKDNENRKMPITSLLIAYIAAAGGLSYLAYSAKELIEFGDFFSSLLSNFPAPMIFGPIIAITVYALLRAMQSRFGRVRRSAPLTFIATVRYASAIAVGLFSIVYLCMLLLTAHYGVKADVYARNFGKQEAAILRSAFK